MVREQRMLGLSSEVIRILKRDVIKRAFRITERPHHPSNMKYANICRNTCEEKDGSGANIVPQNDLRNAKKFRTSCFVTPDWNDGQRYEFEERAAIIEFDGQLPRDIAEFVAAGIQEKKVQRSK